MTASEQQAKAIRQSRIPEKPWETWDVSNIDPATWERIKREVISEKQDSLIDSLYDTIAQQKAQIVELNRKLQKAGEAQSAPDLSRCYTPICDVEIGPLRSWLAGLSWPEVAPHKPQRIFDIPDELFWPVANAVLAHFGLAEVVAADPMLSRMPPGEVHGLHVDDRRSGVLTRVHVVLKTNPGAWMFWEELGRRVHFESGWAYTFDTTKRHAFGNEGDEDRVHLLFEVMRK